MTAIRPVRMGVLSTARIGREKVIPGLRTTPWVEVAAIASRDEGKARETAGALGIAAAYGSYEALLSDPAIEAVYIPTPNDSHVDLSLAAARAGKHVLCEKPAAMNAADADRLAAIPDGIVYAEAFMVRYHPQWIAVRDLVRQGRIGTPLGVQAWFSYANADPDNIRNRPETGGGALLDIGCYPVVVSRFVLDAEPTRIAALVDRDPAFGTDRLTSALMDFGGGRHLTFSVGTQCVPYQRVHVFGTMGRIEVMIPFNAPQGEPTMIRVDDGRLHGDASAETIQLPASDQYGLQGEAFAKAIRGVEPLAYGVEDARRMMRILDGVLAAAETRSWVDLA
jgi:predicted dehydrogenase